MERKAVKFITVFILSLVLVVTCPLLGFQSEAAGQFSFNAFPTSKDVNYTWGAAGNDVCVTVPFSSSFANLSGNGMYEFFIIFNASYVSDDPATYYYFDNVRMVIGERTYNAAFVEGRYFLCQGQFEYNGYLPRCTVYFDLHRIADVALSSYTLTTALTGSSSYSGYIRPLVSDLHFDATAKDFQNLRFNSDTLGYRGQGNFKIDGKLTNLPQLVMNDISASTSSSGTIIGNAENKAALLSGGTFYMNVDTFDVAYLGESERGFLQQQTQQQHSDAQDQLKESQKQTDAMTKFDGKADMDKNSSDLNNSLSGYDEAQQSIFASSTVSIEKFDVDNLFNFTVNISSALLVWNNLMVSIVASMGDFSLIYTISMGLVFIGIVVGIWRFFVK